MTLAERKRMIDNKVVNDKKKAIVEEKRANDEFQKYLKAIQDLTPRINELIELAWYAMDNGVELNKRGYCGGENYAMGCFVSNHWSHLVGIMNRDYLGIANGGACGYIDFYTNGTETYGFNTNSQTRVEPRLSDMKRFLNEFDELEKCLCEYIDKKCA